jgi:hypothetical protein
MLEHALARYGLAEARKQAERRPARPGASRVVAAVAFLTGCVDHAIAADERGRRGELVVDEVGRCGRVGIVDHPR